MAKASRTSYACSGCGATSAKWLGQCPDCGAWNTLEAVTAGPRDWRGYAAAAGPGPGPVVTTLDAIDTQERPRVPSGMDELDRVLGGGFVRGSVVLLGGQPGAGKSTLLLQVVAGLAQAGHGVLYATGEESLAQVALRAERLGLPRRAVAALAETNVDRLLGVLAKHPADFLVVDSVQVMHRQGEGTGVPGGVTQVRAVAQALTQYAKQTGTTVLLVGHVTKEGGLAGPKVLEHIIDASLLLESEVGARFRLLRSRKNRFGAAEELGVFAMTEKGMRPVANPSAIFLGSRDRPPPAGSAVLVTWEGTRPLLVELQVLVDEAQGAAPRRLAVGLDGNRLGLLLAVLHRHGGYALGDQDVFANVVGGLRIHETGLDLAVALAVVSSFRDRPLSPGLVVFGEIGLTGELRPVANGQERIREAAKHGFTRAVIAYGNRPPQPVEGLRIAPVRDLGAALEAVFEPD